MTTAKPDTTSDKPFRETLVLEGKKYELQSLEVRDFTTIEKQATKKELDEITGATREVLDGQFQMELLMRRMIVTGLPKGGPERLSMRHYSNLRTRINELNFGSLPNEFKNGNEPEEEDETEGEGKGEA